MDDMIPTVIVTVPTDISSWFYRRSWLPFGIRRTQIEKLRVLPFIRVLSLLATDQLLDQRGIAQGTDEPFNLDVLRGLPADWALLGLVRVGRKAVSIESTFLTMPDRGDDGFRVRWEGPYINLLEGVNSVSGQLARGMADALRTTLTEDILESVRKAGIPSRIDAYEALCKATATRVGSEKATFYSQAISIDPNCASAYAGLGTHLARSGRLAEAIQCFERQIDLAPQDHDGFSSLGTATSSLGESERAVDLLQQASIRYQQGDPDVFSNLGAAYHSIGRLDDALVQYRRALKLNPLDPDVHFNIGKCLIGQSNALEAAKWLAKAADLYGPLFSEKRRRVLQMIDSLAP